MSPPIHPNDQSYITPPSRPSIMTLPLAFAPMPPNPNEARAFDPLNVNQLNKTPPQMPLLPAHWFGDSQSSFLHPVSQPVDEEIEHTETRKKFQYSKEVNQALLRQMNLAGHNPYTAAFGSVGSVWMKLLTFMKDQFGADLKQTALKRHVDELMAKRGKELEVAKYESGTNENYGEYEQLLDGLLKVVQEHDDQKKGKKEKEAARKEQEHVMIGEIRDAALKRTSERDESRSKRRKVRVSPSSTDNWMEAERQFASERNKERAESMKLMLEAQATRDEQRSRETQAFFERMAEQNQQMMNLLIAALTKTT